jgi:thioesterase domain-containing protein/acyl carrier protein
VHAAGTLGAATPVASADAGDFAEAMRGKLTGAWWLHLLLRDQPLDFFVLVSSVSALWGLDGYGAYAAANGGLDMIADYRIASGLRAVAIAYGPWAGAGMANESGLAMLSRAGVDGLDPAAGCEALTAQGPAGTPYLVCCPVRWPRFAAVMAARRSRALYQALAAPSAELEGERGKQPAAEGQPGMLERLVSLDDLDRRQAVLDLLRSQVASVLGHSSTEAISSTRTFPELGFDSLTAVELRNRLIELTTLNLPSTIVFDHPALADLADYLADKLSSDIPPATASAEDSGAADPISELYLTAVEDNKIETGNQLLLNVARLRPMFADRSQLPNPPALLPLVTGAAELRLVCVNPITPATGAHVYYQFAARWPGEEGMSALPVPGFATSEQLPVDAAALVTLQAQTVLEHVGNAPFVMLGTSSGGLLAHEVARHLCELGRPPRAVVMLDTYTFHHPYLKMNDEAFSKIIYDRSYSVVPIDSTRLSAFMWIRELFVAWNPQPLPVPTMLVRATEAMRPEMAVGDWQTKLNGVAAVVDVPGNHFSMMEEHAETTTRAIYDWLGLGPMPPASALSGAAVGPEPLAEPGRGDRASGPIPGKQPGGRGR